MRADARFRFRTEKDAKKALKHFNNTFVDTSKIVIEFARPVGDAALARPWSKYSEGSSANRLHRERQERAAAKENGKEAGESASKKAGMRADDKKMTVDQALLHKARHDPEMRAFVETFARRSKKQVWQNDDAELERATVQQVAVPSRKAGGEGVVHTRTHIKFEGEDSGDEGASDEEYQDIPDLAQGRGGEGGAVADDGAAFDEALDDMAYLKKKVASSAAFSDSDEEGEEGEDEGEEEGEEEGDEEEEDRSAGKKGKKGKKPSPPPPFLVLSGHAASLTPY